MTQQTLFGKGLEDIARIELERKQAIEELTNPKSDEDYLVFNTSACNKNPNSKLEEESTFYAMDFKGALKKLGSFPYSSSPQAFCGFNGKLYCSIPEIISSVEKNPQEYKKIPNIIDGMCANNNWLYLLTPTFDADEDNERFVFRLDPQLNVESAEILRNTAFGGTIVCNNQRYEVSMNSPKYELGVLVNQGKFFSIISSNDCTPILLDENKQPILKLEGLLSEDEMYGAEIFNGDIFLSGYEIPTDLNDPLRSKGLAKFDIKKRKVERVLSNYEIVKFKKVKHRDIAYLLEGAEDV